MEPERVEAKHMSGLGAIKGRVNVYGISALGWFALAYQKVAVLQV